MTTHEEKLILQLHSQWGNRWSRIARRLPGRTDNEIKNYWRTYMRKQAQEKKDEISPSPSASLSSSSSSVLNSCSSSDSPAVNSKTVIEKTIAGSFQSTEEGAGRSSAVQENKYKRDGENGEGFYSMDDIWKDITTSSEEEPIKGVCNGYSEGGNDFSCPPMASPLWEYRPDSLWNMEDDGSNIFSPTNDHFLPCYQNQYVSNYIH